MYWRAADIPGWADLRRDERSHVLMAARTASWKRGRAWAGIAVFAVGAAVALGNMVDASTGLLVVVVLGAAMVLNMAAVVQQELVACIRDRKNSGRAAR